MRTIPPLDLHNLLQTQPDLTLLDIRTAVEFADIHVPQARNEPLETLEPSRLVKGGSQAGPGPVYLICRAGGQAAQAAERLAKAGFNDATVVEGGMLAWVRARLPVTRGYASGISLERQIRIAAGVLVLTGVLLGWLVHPALFGLTAFVGAGLTIAGLTDRRGIGLLLAKLPRNTRTTA